MRYLKGMIVGALALGGLMTTEAGASALPLGAPALIDVMPVHADAATTGKDALPCYWGWHRHWGWHGYGWHRPWGYHRYGWGWHRPWGWHRHYGGWHRWHRW